MHHGSHTSTWVEFSSAFYCDLVAAWLVFEILRGIDFKCETVAKSSVDNMYMYYCITVFLVKIFFNFVTFAASHICGQVSKSKKLLRLSYLKVHYVI